MALFSSLFTLLFTPTGWAVEPAAITLDVTLQIGQEVAATPKVTSVSGQPAQIKMVPDDDNGVFIQLTPTLRDGNQVHMNIVLATQIDGEEKIVSQPQLVSLLGQSAEFSHVPADASSKPITVMITPTLHK